MNRYRVLLFARYAELFGAEQVEVTLPHGTHATELIAALRKLPGGGMLPATPFLAVNQARADPSTVLSPTDELALLPPLAGG